MATTLLTTKLRLPTTRSPLVARPYLLARLDETLKHRLTLVSAPPGYGKTTLLAEWLSQTERSFAWLTLDEDDNDLVRFLNYLVAALQKIDPDIGQTLAPMMPTPPTRAPEVTLTNLINDIDGVASPFALILDDYQVINTLLIHQALTYLLDHLPPNMHLVLASREDPPLPLSHWRARGQMLELRQADLHFSLAETTAFLRQVMQLQLSSADVAAIHKRTEGWIAGMQLTALSLQGRDDAHELVQSFTGSHRHILDYLVQEVFERQIAPVQDFLLKTSILDQFTPALCDVLTGRTDSHEILLALEHANLFIVPLDESRQWYRYHRLFADLLRHRLALEKDKEFVTLLHKKASLWYEDHGYPDEAIDHALEAQDWQRAAALLSQVSGSFLARGEMTILLRWFQALPDDVIRSNPQSCYEYSWPLILTGQLDAADSYLEQAREAADGDPVLLRQVVSAQVHIARTRGDDSRTIALSRQVLPLLTDQDLGERGVVTVALGIAHCNRGDLTEAYTTLREALEASEKTNNTFAKWVSLNFLGRVDAARGRLRQAARLYQQVLSEGSQSGPSMPLAIAHLDLGGLLHEGDDLEGAYDHVQQCLDLARRNGHLEVEISGYRLLAMLRQAQGMDAEALQALEHAHQLTNEGQAALPPLAGARNAACHVQIALAQGDLATATRWAGRMWDDADASSFCPHVNLTKARLLMAQERNAEAHEWLESCYATAKERGSGWATMRARILQALNAPTPAAALPLLAEALAIAEPERFVRTFVDEGAPLAALLHRAAERGIAHRYVARLLAAIEADAFRKKGAPTPGPPQTLIEPLSQRELEVLRLAAEGLSNQEIANRLVISVGTVKTHVHNILGKLEVRGRTEAAARARELDLL